MLERQHPVLEKPEFMVTPDTSKALGAESGPLFIFNSLPSGAPRGESSGDSVPFAIAISSVILRN